MIDKAGRTAPRPMRTNGWESRLGATIESARHKPYQLGRHDCFTFAGQCMAALTGVDTTLPWRGRYRTPRGALRLLRKHGGSIEGALEILTGSKAAAAGMARRGDWLLYLDAGGPHIGVCVGARVAVLADDGLRFVGLKDCRAAFAVG